MNSTKGQFKKQYKRISKEKQNSLIELVFKHQWKIKYAAQFLTIIYSSAKNVITRYRKTIILRKLIKNNAKRCHYKMLVNGDSQIQVKCTCGGIQRQ